ncbi:Protein of unknown function (DUF3617) [Mariprofundus ferrinatatus]|uniref:DUF3617 family protein n=1 Tax=Mariprofundus ferrinatatus TaxID=1921087 RepID=A0A2K8L142_9PROT|nr:DUF3617 family protein [Mariprofundus ferrinatatus]ATX81035.1 Protein of unknown function (DUF3617) [Mariprofundus ferrinatatus]
MNHFNALSLTLLVCFSATACSDDQLLEEGEWEMTSQMEMRGMPEGMPAMPPVIYRQCLTNEMMVPTQEQGNKSCETVEQTVSGNTVTWHMRCSSQGVPSEMNGSSTYTGDSMQGSMQITTQGMEITSRITGKRLGPCKK